MRSLHTQLRDKALSQMCIRDRPTVVAKGIREGESISMKGFGSFVPWQQSERLARNPKTGEEVMITPRVSVKFKAGSDLLKELNE